MLVVWGTPQVRDLLRVEQTVMSLYEQGGSVVFVARVPPNAPAPDEAFRSELSHVLSRTSKALASYHAVLEGKGFVAAAKRTVLATAFLMTGPRFKYYIHSNIDEVPLAVSTAVRPEVHAAVMYFQRHGHTLHSVRPSPPRAQHAS